jgi:hypothetical protein
MWWGGNFLPVKRSGNTISLIQHGSQTARNKNKKIKGSKGIHWATLKAVK